MQKAASKASDIGCFQCIFPKDPWGLWNSWEMQLGNLFKHPRKSTPETAAFQVRPNSWLLLPELESRSQTSSGDGHRINISDWSQRSAMMLATKIIHQLPEELCITRNIWAQVASSRLQNHIHLNLLEFPQLAKSGFSALLSPKTLWPPASKLSPKRRERSKPQAFQEKPKSHSKILNQLSCPEMKSNKPTVSINFVPTDCPQSCLVRN